MKEIPLTRGMVAIVDDADYPDLAKHKWTYSGRYAIRRGRTGNRQYPTVYMHRVITNANPEEQVDHINSNSLDNRRTNLRVCSKAQNMMNRPAVRKENRSSRYKGVCFLKKDKRWVAHIVASGRQHYLGRFRTEEQAAAAYNEAALRLHGEFAQLNEIQT